jgi:hypothetical protein
VPKRIVLDIDDTFDRVHGGQQLRLFNAYYDDYGFQSIVVFDAEGRFVTALLRPGKRPSGVEIRGFVRRLVGALRSHWPKVEILLRADSHYASLAKSPIAAMRPSTGTGSSNPPPSRGESCANLHAGGAGPDGGESDRSWSATGARGGTASGGATASGRRGWSR